MQKGQHDLEIVVKRDGITPATFSAHDLAALLVAAEKSVAAIVKSDYPEIDTSGMILGLTDVIESSAGFVVRPSHINYQGPAFAEWTKSIGSDSFDGLPRAAYEGAEILSKISSRLDATIGLSMRANGSLTSVDIVPEMELTAPAPALLRGRTEIFGEVVGVGGAKDPKVKIRRHNRPVMTFGVDKALAQRLAEYLYRHVGLSGEAIWDAESHDILSFHVTDVLSTSPKPLGEALSRLAEIARPYYDEIPDAVAYVRNLRDGD